VGITLENRMAKARERFAHAAVEIQQQEIKNTIMNTAALAPPAPAGEAIRAAAAIDFLPAALFGAGVGFLQVHGAPTATGAKQVVRTAINAAVVDERIKDLAYGMLDFIEDEAKAVNAFTNDLDGVAAFDLCRSQLLAQITATSNLIRERAHNAAVPIGQRQAHFIPLQNSITLLKEVFTSALGLFQQLGSPV
jgi:hypothetical protein